MENKDRFSTEKDFDIDNNSDMDNNSETPISSYNQELSTKKLAEEMQNGNFDSIMDEFDYTADQEDVFTKEITPEDILGGAIIAPVAKSKKQKRNKYISIIISIIIAIFLWFYVINDENPTIDKPFYDIPVEFLNINSLDENGLILSSTDEPLIKVVVRGKRSSVFGINKNDIVATIDVSQYNSGDNYVDVNIHVPSSVEVVSTNPTQVKLSIEDKATAEKKVAVVFNGSVASNRETHYEDLAIETSIVSGPKSYVRKVSRIIAEVDVKNMTTSPVPMDIILIPVDANNKPVENVSVQTEVTSLVAQLYTVKNVKLDVKTKGTPASGYDFVSIDVPSTVMIAGPDDVVSKIESVMADDIDITGFNQDTDAVLLIEWPEGTKRAAKQDSVTARVEIAEAAGKTYAYDLSNAVLENVPEGMEASIESDSLNITASGNGGDLSEITVSDFSVYIDCTDLNEGSNTCIADIRLSEKAQNVGVIVDSASVKVNLKSKDGE